jgi:adenylate kinase family enzyme
MNHLVVALSGPIAAGKTTLAAGLASRCKGLHVRTHELLLRHAQKLQIADTRTRAAMQHLGDVIEGESEGQWLAIDLHELLQDRPPAGLTVVDAVRTSSQVRALRGRFAGRVRHVHVEVADTAELERRYLQRAGSFVEFAQLQDTRCNATEARVPELASLADFTVNALELGPESIVDVCLERLGLTSGLPT